MLSSKHSSKIVRRDRWISIVIFVLAMLVASIPGKAALPNNTIAWEVRPTVGADTNGCGYVAGTAATTTDYSQNNNKNAAACSNCGSSTQDLSTTDAVSNGTTTITSATANFVAVKGNIIRFNGGSGSIATQRRHVTAVNSTTSITIDASIAASTGMTMNIGGACATIAASGAVFTNNTIGNKIFVKDTGNLTITASQSLNNSLAPTTTQPWNRIIGYTTSRTDAGRFHVVFSTNTGIIGFDRTGGSIQGWSIENVDINCSSLGTSIGINIDDSSQVINSKVSNCTSNGILVNNGNFSLISDSEVTGCTSGCTTGAISMTGPGTTLRNWIHDNASLALKVGNRANVLYNLITNNTGASSDGVQGFSAGSVIFGNTIYASGRHGLNENSNAVLQTNVRNNLLVNNGISSGTGFGFLGPTAQGTAALPQFDGNAYFNNQSGNRSNLDDTTTNVINGVAPYTNVLDVTTALTCDPFVNAAGNNFALNQLACGGLAVRQAGTPGPVGGNGSTTTGNTPIGATGSGTLASGGFCAIHN